jgi:hypothetical protein
MTRVVNIAQSGGNNVTMRNRIINGAMMIDQRNAGASVTCSAGTSPYTVDRMRATNQTDGTFTAQQSATAPAGFTNSLLITSTVADASLGATQYAQVEQRVEGNNIADLGWGTANAQPVTLSFWVRSNLTGTFCATLYNNNGSRSYVSTYTINAANTFEYKTITVAGDTSGTWQTGTSTGIDVIFCLAVGSTYQQAAGAWGATSFAIGTSGQTNFMASTSNTFYITGVQLEAGTTATPFENRLYGTELLLCQRYYEVFYSNAQGQPATSYYYGSGANYFWNWFFKQEKRAQATVAKVNGFYTGATPTIYGGISDAQFYATGIFFLTTTTGQVAFSASAEL